MPAPYLPFAVPVGTGSVGWQAAAHPALSDMPLLSHNPARGQIEGLGMRRRDFIILLAGAMGGWSSVLRAQQKAMPRTHLARFGAFR
jgi:hypothetical protein